MGDFYTINYAAAFNASPGKLIPANIWGAVKRVFLDSYEAVALAAASTLHVLRPPKGAKIVGGKVTSDNLGNNTTLEAGIAGATAKFMAATNHGGAAAQTALLGAPQIDAIGYEFDGETDLIITTGVGEAGGTIVLEAEFINWN